MLNILAKWKEVGSYYYRISKQAWLSNCIGVIDESHIVVRAPSDIVIVADHHISMKKNVHVITRSVW